MRKVSPLAERIRSGNLDGESLTGAKLANEKFAGVALEFVELQKADLASTRWRDSNLKGVNMQGAKLEGARFENCNFEMADLDEVKARGVVFEGCTFDTLMRTADLRDAKLVDVAADAQIDISFSNARGLAAELAYTQPGRANWFSATRADLRGATVRFDITADARRAHAKRKPKGEYDWYRGLADEVKSDKHTRIEYAELPGGGRARANDLLPSAGAPAAIGVLHAQNAGLWCLAIDANSAGAWQGDNGYTYDEDVTLDENLDADASDFGRAMKIAETRQRTISVGRSAGLIVTIGGCGWSTIWRIEGGIMLVDFAPSDQVEDDKPATIARVGAAALHAKVKGRSRSLGSVRVRSGVLALLLPAESGTFTATQIARAAKSSKAVSARPSRALVPLRNGMYECLIDRIDLRNAELGHIDSRVRFVRER